MAKKGQKFNKYSNEFRDKIINEYFSGNSGGSIYLGKKYNISNYTIDTWIRKYKKQGNLDNDINHTRGRKKEENIDYKERYEILKKYQAFLIIGNIEGLKTRNIIEGEVADVLEQISADAYKEAQNFNVFLENFATIVNKTADEVEKIDEESSKKLTSENLLKGVNYKSDGMSKNSISYDPTTGVPKVTTKVNFGFGEFEV